MFWNSHKFHNCAMQNSLFVKKLYVFLFPLNVILFFKTQRSYFFFRKNISSKAIFVCKILQTIWAIKKEFDFFEQPTIILEKNIIKGLK